MAINMKTMTFPCRGGLDLSSNNEELLNQPNLAIKLQNFENSKQGGYRRISGWEEYGSVALPETGEVNGIWNHNGILACVGSNVYHTYDGTYWLQVNKDVTNGNEATLLSASVISRQPADRWMFDEYLVGSKKYIFGVDGVNDPMVFSIEGDSRTFAEYRVKEITEGTELRGAKYCKLVKGQLILAGMNNNVSSIYYSSIASTDLISPEDDDKEVPQENFNGSTSGFISVGDEVTGLAMQRDELYVFCLHSIFKVVGMDTGNPQVVPVTRDIGCIDGFTIQEMGGDLVYLAPDGLRTVSRTERIGDLELGVISRKIDPILDPIVSNRQAYKFLSTVIREKNQYRLWFYDTASPESGQRGIIASYTYASNTAGQRSFDWAYSEITGLECSAVHSGYYESKERVVMGNSSGIIGIQDVGNTFNGTEIPFVYQSAYTDLGDVSIRKNIRKVFVSTKPEGIVKLGLNLLYNYEDRDTHQPAVYPMEQVTIPAVFGSVSFGDPSVLFGSSELSERDLYTEGSGHVVSFKITPMIREQGEPFDSPFDVQSLKIDLTGGGKI